MPRWIRILLDDVRCRVAAAAILGTLPAAVIIAWTAVDSTRELERQALQQMDREARGLSARVNELFEATQRALSSQATMLAMQQEPACEATLGALVSRRLWIKAAWSTDATGAVTCTMGTDELLTNRSDRRDFIDAVATGDVAVGSHEQDSVGRTFVPLSAAVLDRDRHLLGTLGASVDLSWANTIVEENVLPPETLITILSEDLTVLFRNAEPASYVGRKLEGAGLVAQLSNRSVTSFRARGTDGVDRIYAASRLPTAGLIVLVGVPENEVSEESQTWTRSALLAIGASAAFSLILLLLLLQRLVARPVDSLVAAASNLGAGVGTARIGSNMIGGQFGKLASTFNNMADQIDARERALRESKDRLHAIMEHSVDGLITIDARGTVLSFSGPAERIFGYSAEEVVGRNVRMLMPEPFHSAHDDYLANYLRTGQAKVIGVGREVEGRRKDGSVFPMDIAVGEIPTVSGLRQFVGTVRDITERRTVENQLRQVHKMEAVGQLTGGIAHDFNNLLAVIMGNLELMGDRTPTEDPGRKLVDAALHATNRGADLTRRLLAFSRHQPLQPERIAANDLVCGTLDLLKRTLGESINIEARLGDDTGGILVDPGQLENALLNLALNARDAMPKGGRLVIETRKTMLDADNGNSWKNVKPGPYVLISVSDTGNGMTPEVAARAFEPFFTTKDVGKGTGLGLSMVYGFVQQSGGHIGIYSEPGTGTTVRIYLPHTAGDGESSTASGGKESTSHGQGEHVLVVEDNDDVRQLVIRQLTGLGYQVEAVANGREAEACLRGTAVIDLLISDVVLPGGMSGAEIADAARRLRPGLPVLYMSGYTEGIIEAERMTAEGSVLLPKPFTKAQLSAAIDQVLAKTRKAS